MTEGMALLLGMTEGMALLLGMTEGMALLLGTTGGMTQITFYSSNLQLLSLATSITSVFQL
jgi:hypothetical protein